MSRLDESRRPIERVGALSAWHARLRSGELGERPDVSSTWKLDWLWKAAAYEASALELERQGFDSATREMDKAADVIREHSRQESSA